MNRLVVCTLVTLHLAAATEAQTRTPEMPAAPGAPSAVLTVGDVAPPLAVEAFLAGRPITAFETGNVYVVEFWATWCAPCLEMMPHLSELQAHFADRDVTIVGVDIREMRRSGEGFVESFDAQMRAHVEAFVRAQGERMAYTVAFDGAAKAMDDGWMKASGSEGLPTTFVVDRAGRIAWIGHPMVLRMPLHEVVEGTWDTQTGPGRVKQAEEAYLAALRLLASDAEAGLAAWDRAAAEHPLLKDDLIGPKYDALLAAGHRDEADAVGETYLAQLLRRRDVKALNRLAWSLVDPAAERATRDLDLDLDLALRAAQAADTLAHGQDAGVLDTRARVHFLLGEFDTAIALQSRALELADEPLRSRLAPTLAEYEQARRESDSGD